MLVRHVRSNQYRTPFNTLLPERGLAAGEPGTLEGAGQSAGHVSRRFTQTGREGTVGDDRDAMRRQSERAQRPRRGRRGRGVTEQSKHQWVWHVVVCPS